MAKVVLFEGKTTMGGMDVELKIFRVEEEGMKYYEWDYNPHLVDEGQADVHIGQINRGEDLETILFRINIYKNDIKKIKEVKPNPNF
ncbi:MAG: hypothetical protein J5932_03085 [Prevotella sp.]|nr:hypothetical protein [Prevotella sp.]MBP3843996.1 hypothetical protein [Prevotella sp.]